MTRQTELDAVEDALQRFAHAGDFERDWGMARAEGERRTWPSMAAMVIPSLATAAVLALVVWSVLPEAAVDEGAASSTVPPGLEPAGPAVPDGALVLGVNRASIRSAQDVKAVAVVRPEVVKVRNLGKYLQLQGAQPGRTDIVWTFGDGRTEIQTVVVVEEDISVTAPRVGLTSGAYVMIELAERPVAFAVVDTDVMELMPVGDARRYALKGRVPGVSDLTVTYADRSEILTVEVADPDAYVRPWTAGATPSSVRLVQEVVQEMTVAVGEARPLAVSGLESASLVRPELAELQQTNTGMLVLGRTPGTTDLLLTSKDGRTHHRITVTE